MCKTFPSIQMMSRYSYLSDNFSDTVLWHFVSKLLCQPYLAIFLKYIRYTLKFSQKVSSNNYTQSFMNFSKYSVSNAFENDQRSV